MAENQEPTTPSLAKKATALIYWENQTESAAVVVVGLLWFVLIGWVGYASTTVLCYLALFHLIARLVYRNSLHVLAGLNLIEKRPALEAAPETFVSEADVERVLKTATKLVNSTLRSAYSLALGDCTPLVLKWIAGLYAVALASKLLGTTGLCFLLFAGTLSLPKVYQLKQPQIDAALEQASAKVLQQLEQLTSKLTTASKEMLGKLPTIPKASDLKAANVKPKAL